MKSLKQIREEYNDNIMHLVNESDESLLEAKKDKDSMIQNVVPSFKEMPMMLLFRRVSYRIYPHKQVVALYYSSMLNKYLSIPFGPGGNLNLSEAQVFDTIEELNEGLADAADAAADAFVPYYSAGKKAFKGDWKGAAKDAAIDTGLMIATGGAGKLAAGAAKLGAKAIAKGASKLGAKTAIKRDASAIAKSAEKSAAKGKKPGVLTRIKDRVKSAGKLGAAAGVGAAVGSATSGGGSGSSSDSGSRVTPVSTAHLRSTDSGKTGSSWDKKAGSDTARQAKERIAHDKQLGIKENKISDIRAMINSSETIHEMNINGKTITLNNTMAKRILEVYDSVNTKNKKIVEGMLNEDLESFKKLLTFSIRN